MSTDITPDKNQNNIFSCEKYRMQLRASRKRKALEKKEFEDALQRMNPNNCQATCLNEDQKNDSPFEELAIQLRASYKRKSLEKKELMQRVILAGKRRDLIEDTKLLNYLASLADS